MPVDRLELAEPDRGGEVRHPVVEPHRGEPVPAQRILALTAEVRDSLRKAVVVRDDDSAFAGGDDLVSVQAEGSDVADRPHGPAVVLGAVRLGSVLQDEEVVPAGE